MYSFASSAVISRFNPTRVRLKLPDAVQAGEPTVLQPHEGSSETIPADRDGVAV